MADIDTQWFKDRFADKELSLRGVAKLLEMSPSSLSLRINGEYKITMEEATTLARLLGVPFEDVVRRAGINVPRDSAKMVRIIGTVDVKGVVKPQKGVLVPRPDMPAADIVAIKGVADGWLYLFTPSKKLEPDAVGHLAVVENRWVGVLERGSERGLWNVMGVAEGVRVSMAAPVVMIIP